MIAVKGAVPLIALPAVGFDTETTGLDTGSARIIEMGAVLIDKGAVREDRTLEMLVDPGVPVPATATAIHGIDETALRGAPGFREAWDALQRFIARRTLIGHSIGFDLAVLEKEAERAGLAWQKPRTLCVRLLASLVNPRLPDYSLETIASWLGLTLSGRHRALSDARTAAHIFVHLLPHLAERGVRTLAEAERACLGLSEQLETHERAGWSQPVTPPEPALRQRTLRLVDPYAYRHRIADVMSTPPLVLGADETARTAIRTMVDRKISSVFVSEKGEGGRPLEDYGIVTERDMMRRIATMGEAALDSKIGSFASRPLVSIDASAFVYRAVGRMNRFRIRHLAVCDAEDRLAGIVSARDLLKLRAEAAINLDDAIDEAEDEHEMAAAWATLPTVANALIAEEIDARIIAEIVSEELRALTRRAAILAEREMEREGHGSPPCPYAVMVLGSGGRGESLLAPDQDNAIIFAEGEPDGGEDRWFARLGQKVAIMLDMAGVPLCKGGVMARNAEWRGSRTTWHERIKGWVGHSRPQDLLNVDIFFDMRPVHGETRLAAELFDHAYALGSARPDFAKLLGERLAARGSPFTLLGGFRTENGRLDLKMHGLFPAVSLARTLAIRYDIRLHSTHERLEALMALDLGAEADLLRAMRAHGLCVRLLLDQQSRDLLAGIGVSNRVEIAELSRPDQEALREALKFMQIVPDLVRSLMFRAGSR
jgi:DNA polymerase-3 subunit epsilon/CBS domain-containing protein